MVGAAVGIGALWYATKDATPATTLEDNQAKSYTQISGDGGSGDNREESIDNVSKFLGECGLTPEGEESGGNTVNTCVAPLWSANESITIEHPLAATNSDYAQYNFTVSIVADMLSSMTEDVFNALPEGQMLGDYTISFERSGGWQEDSRWTANQNATDSNGPVNKQNAMSPANSVMPTWDECLAAFGGYMPNFVAALGDEVIFRQGYFDDVGQWRYEKQGADGEPYPTSSNNMALDLNGNMIGLYAQLQYKCSTNDEWLDSGPKVQVTSANILGMVGDNTDGSTCYAPCYPAVIPTSGVALGCTLPSVNIQYPDKIFVYCDSFGGQDCSNVPNTSTGGKSFTEWWNLNTSANTPTTMRKGGWNTPSGAVWSKLFDSTRPRVYSDSQGWYVYAGSGGTSNPTKHYINSVLSGFNLAYTRQSETCTCPPDTVNSGETFTITDKDECPGKKMTIIGGGNDEWKTTYCGGLAPVVGCTDPRAENYCATCIDSTPANDPCALPSANLCTYPEGTLLPECAFGGDDGFPGGGDGLGGIGENIGVVNVNLNRAETILKPRNCINTGHSFINW
tara:strand:- start:9206 stop:10903 length:1698 start_codon:yes stop_codon:yes gene_type:complete